MFYARINELKTLEETYNKPGFQMTIIYGRRRVGKSTLIKEFIKDKRASYYMAAQTSLEDNIKKWADQFIDDLMPSVKGASFDDPDKLFQFIGKACSDEKTVVVLDEIPYVAEADPSFLSVFQRAIDNIYANKNIYLILCGSAISFMEKEILSEKSPLFGRRTNQIYLKPFDYIDSALFVPRYTFEEKAVVYGVTGGVAKYLSLFNDNMSLDDNLINIYFKTSGYLYDEAANLLTQEFRSIATYNVVIEVCSLGANKLTEIADKAHISTASLTYIIKSLTTVGIISKVVPITDENNKKKTKYEITDGMYRFWYKFIPSAKAAIEMNRGEAYYYKNVKPRLHEYMGAVFEEMCRHYTLLQGLEGNLNSFITETGTWWGTGHDHKPTDIDVVGIDSASKKAVIGECKFKNEVVDKAVCDSLMERRALIDKHYKEVQYLLFSLTGFSKWLEEETDRDMVRLVKLEDMYNC